MSLASARVSRTLSRSLASSATRFATTPRSTLPLKAYSRHSTRAAPHSVRSFSSSMTASSGAPTAAPTQEYDKEIVDIQKYVTSYDSKISPLALDTARLVFLDTLGCGLKALAFPELVDLIQPIAGQSMKHGARTPGTGLEQDPVTAAFSVGAAIRFLDFNDCWLAAEWGHPSDQLGAYLAVADWANRANKAGQEKINGGKIFTVKDVLLAMTKGHEIQGVLALENSFNRVGLDHVILVKLGAIANVSNMLGLNDEQIKAAISQAMVDGQSLRTYRHAPNATSRKGWAAGDACQRAVMLALRVKAGQPGIPTALTAPTWGFYDVLFKSQPFKFQREYGDYVMENVLFKVSYPAEFHAQTAVEAAELLNPKIKAAGKTAEDIEKVTVRTHEAAIRIIDKRTKKMTGFGDRDHTLQYMVANMLVFNRLVAEDYQDGSEAATSPLLESLRQRIYCEEDPQFTADYHDPGKRYISNALTVTFKDGTSLEELVVETPLGHRKRRDEAKPHIMEKYRRHLEPHYPKEHVQKLMELGEDAERLYAMPVDEYVDLYVKN